MCLNFYFVSLWFIKIRKIQERNDSNIKGELRCIKCGTKGRFVDWRFNCGDHDYLKASSQGVCHALSIMAQLSIKPNEQSFISTTCAVIMQQFVDKIENNE